jgi:hypothetical protein
MSVITLTQDLVEAIFQHLIKKPYEEVAHLIAPLQQQAAPQIQAAQAAADATNPAIVTDVEPTTPAA